MHFYAAPKTLNNCLIQLKLDPFGNARASGDMVETYVSNYDPWGCSGAQVVTTFVSYVAPHFPYIGYFEVYGGI